MRSQARVLSKQREEKLLRLAAKRQGLAAHLPAGEHLCDAALLPLAYL